jgi:OOP family OmpA-OmpF porin
VLCPDWISRTLSPAKILLGGAVGLATWLGSPEQAHAQADYFYLDRAQISGAPDDGFTVWRPTPYGETRFYGFFALGYAHNPLRDETVTTDSQIREQIDDPVKGQFISYLVVGTEVARRVGVNIALPITLYKIAGADPQAQGVGEGGIEDDPFAIHDLRFDARLRLFETDSRKLRLGLGGAIWAPTGNSTAFAGDDNASGWIYGAGEYDTGSFFVSGNLGPHFRKERSIGGPNGTLFTDSELRYELGAYLPLRADKIRLGVELWGTTGISSVGPDEKSTFFSSENTDVEWLGQARILLDKSERLAAMAGFGTRLMTGYGAPDFRVLLSIGTFWTLKDFEPDSPARMVHVTPDVSDHEADRDGDGYPDSIDACPDVKEDGQKPNPTDGCPAGADRDNDGIPDSEDQCPDDPEDRDGVADKDGCPEEDYDNDKIPDTQDKCPTEPGPRSKIAEKHGCPSLTKVTDDGEVALLQPIEFEFGKAVIKPVSYPILDEVVALMKARPSIRIGVYGHTDSRGANALNMRLSKERAAACKNYLGKNGINLNRLESEGFGPNKPIDSNDTDEGRARNRRVEFKILSE